MEKLAHTSTVVRPGKTFMRRMFELLAGTKKAFHHIKLGQAFRSDLLWWLTFMEEWNGVTIMNVDTNECPGFHVWSDASGGIGCGAVELASQQWFQLKWAESCNLGQGTKEEESILSLELLPIVMACMIWGMRWRQSTNTGVVAVINE